MPFQPPRIAVVGATGPTGYHLTRELLERGREVRVIARHRGRLQHRFAGLPVEIVAADALDPQSLTAAVVGCGLVVDAIGLPPERMADHPRVARHVARAAEAAGARCLQISSFWAFLPHRGEVVDEHHPREGGHRWFQLRREAEDVLLTAGAAVVHLPDFFGPHVHTSSVQNALQEAASGKPMNCLGSPDVEREAAYVPDAMRTVAELAERDEAYGTDWGIPGNGTPSPRDLARLAGEHLGREVKLRCVPTWLIRLLAPLVPPMRPAVPLAPHYSQPVRYDTSKLRGLLGEQARTPLARAVATTLDALRERSAGR